jgi:hypothetical protein
MPDQHDVVELLGLDHAGDVAHEGVEGDVPRQQVCWRDVAGRMRAAGHAVFAPTCTGLGERAHLLSREIDEVTDPPGHRLGDAADREAAERMPDQHDVVEPAAARRRAAEESSGGLSLPPPPPAAFGVSDPDLTAWMARRDRRGDGSARASPRRRR